MIGKTLSHYRIVELLGAGGMGEVYRARDTKLDRDVALKIVSSPVASDPVGIARFHQEARVLASLQHPHIAAIYGIEEEEGVVGIAMELVPGETLAARIAQGRIPLKESLAIACRLAEGIEAAHAQGVIHRDLKPANVMLTPEGQVKILDFGLARALTGDPKEAAVADSPTLQPTMTHEGVILGTAAYMSPEQARGKPVSDQSDVWAFGCVLYEMLTGRQAFPGETVSDTIAKVLEREPDWEALPAATPAGVRVLLKRCLAKAPGERLRHIGDARLALEDAGDAPSETGVARAGGSARWWRLIGAGALLAAIVLAIGWWREGRVDDRPELEYLAQTFRRGVVRDARFAPDARTLVYGAAWDGQPLGLYLKRLDSPEPIALEPFPARLLAISKRGEMAVLLHPEGADTLGDVQVGTLAVVPLTGGPPRRVAENVAAAAWHPRENDLALVVRHEETHALEYPAGRRLLETTGWLTRLEFSPDGERIGIAHHPLRQDSRGVAEILDLDGRVLARSEEWEDLAGLAWSATGDEVWYAARRGSRNGVFALSTSGEQRGILDLPGSVMLCDVSEEGDVLLALGDMRFVIRAQAPGWATERDLSWLGGSVVTGISVDGKGLLFTEQGANADPDYEVWLRRMNDPSPVRLGFGLSFDLSPDGRWALATRPAAGAPLTLLPTGSGEPRNLDLGTTIKWASWLPDGRRILVAGNDAQGNSRLCLQDLDGSPPVPLPFEDVTAGVFNRVLVSPDGRFVAASDADGTPRLLPLDGGSSRGIPGLQPNETLAGWTAGGDSVYVVQKMRDLHVSVLDIESGGRRFWKRIGPADPAGVAIYLGPVITPDGKGYAYSYLRWLSTVYLVKGLK